MKRAGVFFDRDNTLIVSDGYLGDPSKVVLVEGAAAAVARVRQLGYAVVVASNQSGVARGMFSEEDVQAVNKRMDELLIAENPAAVVDRHEYCPFHPDGTVDVYARDSDRRKPKPGMILSAAEKLALDLSRSWVIGDAGRDIEAGHAAGCRAIWFNDPKLPASPAATDGPPRGEPEFTVTTLADAVSFIERNPEPKDGLIFPAGARTPGQKSAEGATSSPAVSTAPSGPVVAAPPVSGPRIIRTPDPEPEAEDAPPARAATVAETSSASSASGETGNSPGSGSGAESNSSSAEGKRMPKVAIGSRYVPPEGKEAKDSKEAREAAEQRKQAFRTEFQQMLRGGKPGAAAGAGAASSGEELGVAEEIDERGLPPMPVSAAPPSTPGDRTESLLEQIFLELRRQHEHEDQDFSVSKLLAGIVQILVLAVMFLAYLRRAETSASVQTYLEVALVLQTMTIALLIMSRQK